MASYDGSYDDFAEPLIRGDDYTFPFVVRLPDDGAEAPFTDANATRVNLTSWGEMWCTAKRHADLSRAGDTAAVLQVTKTGGGIVVTAASQGEAKLVFTDTQTGALPTGLISVDIQGVDNTGKIHTLATGLFTVKADVTRAVS